MKFKKFISAAAALSVTISSFSGAAMISASAADGSVTITNQVGWLESAYITWTNTEEADGYNVYVKPEGGSYTKIDDELVRYYGSYYRADALGLAAGTYQMKVAEIKGGAESDIAEAPAVTVVPHIREGFAFDSHSSHYNSGGVGAYKNDGTLKDGAQVVYVTDANKDTVALDVITNKKGTATACKGLGEILTARQKGYDETPLAIRLIGQVESPSGKNSSGYMQIKGTKNITLEGVGNDATTYHWSLLLRETENIEVRNLAVMEFYDDGISLDTNNFNDWVHNCDIFYGQNRGGDQKKGDGSLDVKSGSDYCSFSYNHFWDSGKTSLCGMKADNNKGYHMTYYGNWFDHSDSRHPRVRGDQVHLYNNYYDGVAKYGVGACTGSSVYVEKNVFRNAKYAVLISQQGSDVAGGSVGTFSGEDGGVIKMYDNKITGGNKVVAASSSNTNDFDAYVAASRNEQVSSAYTAKQGGTTYSNFDTASTMYSYSPLETSEVVSKVTKYAGRVENGDFTHEFSSSDDTLYDRDTVLGNALQDYTTALNTEYATGTSYPPTSGTAPTAKPTTAPTTAPTETPAASATPTPTTAPAAAATAAPGELQSVSEATEWGASFWTAKADSYKTDTVLDTISVNGVTDSKAITIDNKRLKFGGTGSASSRNISVLPAVDGTLEIEFAHASSSISDARELGVTQDGKETATAEVNAVTPSNTLTVDVKGGSQVYIYSKKSGINITSMTFTPDAAATALPTAEPTEEPTAEPTAAPTDTPSDSTETVTDMWRASDTAADVTAGTPLKGSWLILVGGDASYGKSSTTINDVKLTGKIVGSANASKATVSQETGGAALKLTPDKNGTIGVYFKINNGKTFYIADADGNEIASCENTGSKSVYTYLSVPVEAGKTYYAFGDATKAEYWAAEYTTTGAYSDDTEDDANFVAYADTPEVAYGIKDGKKDETDYSTYFVITITNIGDGKGSFDKIYLDADGEEYENDEILNVTLAPNAEVKYGAVIEGIAAEDIRNISVDSAEAEKTSETDKE